MARHRRPDVALRRRRPWHAGPFSKWASDPWVDIGPDGTLHMMGLAFNSGALLAGSVSAMLHRRSIDNGRTWSTPWCWPATAPASSTPRTPSRPTLWERGMLVNVFLQIDTVAGIQTSRVAVHRGADRGLTWTAPVFIAEQHTVGTRDAVTGQAIRDGGKI